MAKEYEIKRRVKEILARDGWIMWSGAKAMYQSSDIFGIFDCIAVKVGTENTIRFIQYTSMSNMAARRRKIRAFFAEHNVFLTSELWGYEGGKFKIEQIEKVAQ